MSMNTMTLRDRWLACAIPAMLTLLLGWLIVLRPAAREVASLQQRVRTQGSLASHQALLAGAQADRAELEKAIADKRALPVGEGSVFDRNRAMQEVSLLCEEHHVKLEKSALDSSAQLPPTLKDALPAFATGGTRPQVWRLEVSGTYPNVVKLLDGLQKTKPLIVPLNLSMRSGKSERYPATWKLTLWL